MNEDWHIVLSPYKPPTKHWHEARWCEEKFGERWNPIDNRKGIWRCFWGGPDMKNVYKFEFRNEQDAVFFSLTWL